MIEKLIPRTAGELLARQPKQPMSRVIITYTDGKVDKSLVATATIAKTADEVRALPWIESVEVFD